jgi:hypothetical protein
MMGQEIMSQLTCAKNSAQQMLWKITAGSDGTIKEIEAGAGSPSPAFAFLV